MLRLERVRVRFNGHRAALRVHGHGIRGKTVLIGRNGAGKTTTLRSIMGLLPLEGGRIRLDDSIRTVASHYRARQGIGYAPEDRRLIARILVEDNMLLPALALRLPGAERMRRLDEVYGAAAAAPAMRSRPGGAISGGQGKMVALGRAIVVSTRYILLDEPFQGLARFWRCPTLTPSRSCAGRGRIPTPITELTPKLLDKIVDVSPCRSSAARWCDVPL